MQSQLDGKPVTKGKGEKIEIKADQRTKKRKPRTDVVRRSMRRIMMTSAQRFNSFVCNKKHYIYTYSEPTKKHDIFTVAIDCAIVG